jgi:hypothetical protein
MHDSIGCNNESCDRNNKKECQILDECKTMKTEHLFKCDQGDAMDDMRLQNGESPSLLMQMGIHIFLKNI